MLINALSKLKNLLAKRRTDLLLVLFSRRYKK